MKYKVVDLFAGIGGIRKGFEDAFLNDIETVFVSEMDKYAKDTYRLNFHDDFEISDDITKINEKDIPDFNICLAGFPCQPFSIYGKKLGFNDMYKERCRGTLFFDIIRICEEKLPEVIFLENVKGLLTNKKGDTFNIIQESLKEIGYTVYYKVLNSKSFGVPQNRERVYIVCFRNDIISNNFTFPAEKGESEQCISDIIEKNEVDPKYYVSAVRLEGLKRHKEKQLKKGNNFGYEVKKLNGIANTLIASSSGQTRNLIIDKRLTNFNTKKEINKEMIRKLTPREYARLQGFPDNFLFNVSDTQAYKQFGNSVTVPVIKAIAIEIKKILDNNEVLNNENRE